MKNLVMIFALTVASSSVFAKTESTSILDIRKPIENWIKANKNNFRVGIGFGSLGVNSRLRTNDNGVSRDGSINETSNSKLQLQAGLEKINLKTIGYSAFFTYQDLGDGAFDQEDMRSMRLSGNATYGINKQLYTYGGLNLNDYFGSEQLENGINWGIGYQLGLGLKFHKRAYLEVEYLTLLNEGKIEGFNTDIEAKGIMIKLNTPINFNI